MDRDRFRKNLIATESQISSDLDETIAPQKALATEYLQHERLQMRVSQIFMKRSKSDNALKVNIYGSTHT